MESDIVDDLSDDLIRDVFTYLSTNKYPEASSSSRKRVIRKKALKFFISTSGELMYKQKLKGKEPTFLRYVQSPEERRLILLACHVHPTSGHMGRTRTLHRIKERVMWHGMVKDCTEMIRTCDICQRMNRKLTCGVPELHPIPVKSPWYMIGIDFIGPISPPGEDGSQYILTISDYFTKWVEAIPTPDKTATTVANCLFKIFMRMGLPRVMLSDNGSEFCNKLNDKLAEILGVKRRLTTPYHPQANGLDERYNQTLQNMLAKFVSTKQTVWSSYLDTCTFAYNTSRHESSTYTPFQLMFGRQAILPVDIDLQKESGDELHHKYQMLNDPDIVAVQHKHQVILEDAKKHILDAQKKQKQKYDSKCAKPNCFQVGELVMKKNFRRKKMKGGKLQDRFDGPHRVVKKMPHGVYELISKDGTLIRATGGHLKMYHSNMLQGSISFDDKQASSKVISDDPSTSGVKPDDTSICSDIECYDPSTPSDAKHDGLPTPSNIGCDDTLTPSDAEHDRLPTPSNIGCDDTLTTSDVEHDGLTTPSNTGCDDTLTTSDVERDGLTTPSDVGCDDDTHTISHAKPDDQPTTSDTEPKDLLTLKDAEPPVLLFCSCKTRCATKRCLCKLNHSFCGHYCHPADLAKTPASKRVKGFSGEVMETSSAAGLSKNQLDSLHQDISDLVVAGDHISTIFAGDCMVAKVIKYTRAQVASVAASSKMKESFILRGCLLAKASIVSFTETLIHLCTASRANPFILSSVIVDLSISGTCYTSVLTIPTPQLFSGTTVTCRDGLFGTLIGSGTLNIQLASSPSAPTITSLISTYSDQLTVTWTSVPTATSYNVSINDCVNTLVPIPSTGAPQYSFTGLANNTVYTVSVVAINCAEQ
eukprot:Em0025g18a